mmetsp:Transcript_138569/g.386512  ORF Transcript_138569/g.386512 Transcript_138569/m.386512 type:complete len:226 (+) Transcript_138569:184-861(+)
MLAVVAYNADPHILVLWRHGRLSDLPVHLHPELLVHVERGAADRTTQGLQACKGHLELSEAVLMNGVPTLQDGYLCGGLEEVLQAHRAVLVHRVLHACVVGPDLDGVAAAARIAMKVVLTATDTADAALVAVENLLLDAVVVPEVTGRAVVIAEHLATSHAVAPWRLPREARLADYLPDLRPVDLMRSPAVATLGLIVAVPAPECLPAAGGNYATTASVVAAPLA